MSTMKDALNNPENQKPGNTETAVVESNVDVAALMQSFGDFDEDNDIEAAGSGTAYLDFMHSMKNKAQEIRDAIPGVKDGDPILYQGNFEALEGRVQVWAKMYQCYVKKDNVGAIISVSKEKSQGQEYIVAMLNVIDGDRVFPVITEVGGAKCRFIHDLVDAAKATQAEGWAGSDKVRKGLVGLTPAFRVAGELQTNEKTSRASGMKYHIVSAKTDALTFDEASALNAAIQGDVYGKQVAAAMEQFDRKVAELKMLAK
jgi:hypothetical protein